MIDKGKKEIQFEQPSDILLLANRYIMFIIAFVILGILVSGYFFVLQPKINSTNIVEEKATETEKRRVKNEEFLLTLKELEAEYKDIMNNRQEDLAFLKKIVPEGTQTAELFLMADRLAGKYGFQLLSIDIVAEASKKIVKKDLEDTTETIDDLLASSGIKSTEIKLGVFKRVSAYDDVLGVDIYDDFKDYLAELENTIRLLDIQSIAFESIDAEIYTKDDSPNIVDYLFTLDLITYYQ